MDDAKSYEAIRNSVVVYKRGGRYFELTGLERTDLLSWVLAKSTEYIMPGTCVESLALDDNGQPIDLVLVMFEEERAVIGSNVMSGGLLDDLPRIIEELELEDVEIKPLDWCAIGIEGPNCWEAIKILDEEEDIATMALNERRDIKSPLDADGVLARVGKTAEYGWTWFGEGDEEETYQAFFKLAEEQIAAKAVEDKEKAEAAEAEAEAAEAEAAELAESGEATDEAAEATEEATDEATDEAADEAGAEVEKKPEGPVQNPDAIPVAEATETALLRAQLEVNNAIFPLMFEGITLREAGMEWFAGPNREDDYRGRPEEDPGDRERGLVAVIAEGQDLPEAGTAIMAGEVEIGKVFIKAPLVGLETGYGLALLDAPFEVPGLALMCGDVEIKTIPRPAVEPVSWVKAIGDSTGPTALQEAMAELTAQRTEQAEAAARAAAEAEAKTEAADPELAAALAQLDLEDEEAMETEEYKAWAEAVGRARAQATLETIEAKVAVASTKTNADSEAAEDEE